MVLISESFFLYSAGGHFCKTFLISSYNPQKIIFTISFFSRKVQMKDVDSFLNSTVDIFCQSV